MPSPQPSGILTMQPELLVLLQIPDDPAVPPVPLTGDVMMTRPPVPFWPPPPLPAPPAFVPGTPPPSFSMVPEVQPSPAIARIAAKRLPASWPENCLCRIEVEVRSFRIRVYLAVAGRGLNSSPPTPVIPPAKSIATYVRNWANPIEHGGSVCRGAHSHMHPAAGTCGRFGGKA